MTFDRKAKNANKSQKPDCKKCFKFASFIDGMIITRLAMKAYNSLNQVI